MTCSDFLRDDGLRLPWAPTRNFASTRAGNPHRYAILLLVAAFSAHGAQITVGTKIDNVLVDGQVSLREALLSVAAKADVNADVTAARSSLYSGADLVRISIGSGAQTIALGASLPPVAAGTHVDGSTQPGYVDQNLITLDGTQAGAATDGLVLLEGSRITALDIVKFAGHGLRSDDDILFAHGFDGTGATDPVLDADFVAITIDQCASIDNVGDGVRVDAGTAVDASGLRVLRNRGVGMRVRGALAATQTVVSFNAGDGIVVDSADPVDLDQSDLQYNGQHPQLAPTARAGLRVLRASRPDVVDDLGLVQSLGGVQVHGSGTVANQLGDGVVVGDAAVQTGVIHALIGDLQIHHNLAGIRVAQRDFDAHRTAIAILSNNIYQNASAGLFISTSYMYPTYSADRRVIAANDVHHNAVTPADQCSAATATQTQSQVVFDGPVAATPDEVAACQPAGVDTQSECNALSNPNGVSSNGINNHCVWTGVACTVAWDMGGREGTGECDSSRNRIFAYVNNPNADPSTQRGVAALNDAMVRARRNTWGVGGASNGTFEDSSSNARIDANDDCGSISTCP